MSSVLAWTTGSEEGGVTLKANRVCSTGRRKDMKGKTHRCGRDSGKEGQTEGRGVTRGRVERRQHGGNAQEGRREEGDSEVGGTLKGGHTEGRLWKKRQRAHWN